MRLVLGEMSVIQREIVRVRVNRGILVIGCVSGGVAGAVAQMFGRLLGPERAGRAAPAREKCAAWCLPRHSRALRSYAQPARQPPSVDQSNGHVQLSRRVAQHRAPSIDALLEEQSIDGVNGSDMNGSGGRNTPRVSSADTGLLAHCRGILRRRLSLSLSHAASPECERDRSTEGGEIKKRPSRIRRGAILGQN